jgi:tripartite-type tricarboxylate transporter receptor subunit TctC
LAVSMAAAHAQPAADFYRDKKMTLYVGYPPGGAYDVGARLLARFMGNYLPGSPSFVVMNKPGASGLILANELYSLLPKDGSVFGTVGRNVPREQILGTSKTQFDSTKFNWLGTPSREVSVCAIWHTTDISTTKEFLAKPVILGANSGGDAEVYPIVLNKLLGTNFKLVTGYPGTQEISLALERGEVQGRCGWSWGAISTEQNWLKDGKVKITLLLSTEKLAGYEDIPRAVDFAKTDKDRAILEFLAASGEMGRPFVAPPGVPADRIAALRLAFNAVMKDQAFQAEADKQQYLLDPLGGEEMQAFVEGMAKASAEVQNAVKDVLIRQ